MKDAYIGLGSNLGNPVGQLSAAREKLNHLPQSSLVACSASYRTPPLGGMNQPEYVNAVCHLRTDLSATMLLRQLQKIENQQGRQRSEKRWQARTLDLDLLLYSDEIIVSETLTVPHYAIAQRNFVIFPLLELDPEIAIPGLGKARDIAASLSFEGLEAIPTNKPDCGNQNQH